MTQHISKFQKFGDTSYLAVVQHQARHKRNKKGYGYIPIIYRDCR